MLHSLRIRGSLIPMDVIIETGLLHTEFPHCCDRRNSAIFPLVVDLLPVRRKSCFFPSQMFSFLPGRSDPLRLPLPDGKALLFGNTGQHFGQDVIYHLEYPFLAGG